MSDYLFTRQFFGYADTDKKRTVEDRLQEAMLRYTEKYGNQPDMIVVNASDVEQLVAEMRNKPFLVEGQPPAEAPLDAMAEVGKFCGVGVYTRPYIRPGHFWLGIHEEKVA